MPREEQLTEEEIQKIMTERAGLLKPISEPQADLANSLMSAPALSPQEEHLISTYRNRPEYRSGVQMDRPSLGRSPSYGDPLFGEYGDSMLGSPDFKPTREELIGKIKEVDSSIELFAREGRGDTFRNFGNDQGVGIGARRIGLMEAHRARLIDTLRMMER